MSKLSELREQEKAAQKHCQETQKRLREERDKLAPLETQFTLARKELSRIQSELISELTQQLGGKP